MDKNKSRKHGQLGRELMEAVMGNYKRGILESERRGKLNFVLGSL